jgi:hypothetical protein
MRDYTNTCEQYYNDRNLIKANCDEIMIINTGSVTAYVQGMPLLAGASISFDRQDNDGKNISSFDYNFGGTTIGARLDVWRKNYK